MNSKETKPEAQSTPHGKGTGGRMSQHPSEHTRDYCDPYLKEDISKEQILPLDEFMKTIFERDDWETLIETQDVQDLSKDTEFRSLVDKYAESLEEKELYNPFMRLVNYVLKDRATGELGPISVCRNDPMVIRGSDASRKPDGVGTYSTAFTKTERISPEKCEEKGPEMLPFHWLEVLWYIEFKLKEKAKRKMMASRPLAARDISPTDNRKASRKQTAIDPLSSRKRQRSTKDVGSKGPGSDNKRGRTGSSEQDVKVQCASYALEMLSNGGLRTHALGLYIDGYKVQIQYFDRSAFISSAPFSLRDDPCKFIALLFVFRGLTATQWGLIPGFDHSPLVTATTRPSDKTGIRSMDFLCGSTFELQNGWKLKFEEILARNHGLIGRGTIVIRAHIVNRAEIGEKQAFAVKISSPAITRKNEADILNLAYKKATGKYETMLDHLPRLCYWEDIDPGRRSPREVLPDIFKEEVYERRALRLMVFHELQPIHELATPEELSKAFRDIFKCYRWLYEEAKILHRDISADNMMYYREGSKICGVLNDFDLAKCIDDCGSSPSSKQRTGTKVFMAVDLLLEDGVAHLYRHDLESFFYVILILTSHFENGKEVKKLPLMDWFLSKSRDLADKKTGLLMDRLEDCPRPTPTYEPFSKWLGPMKTMFSTVRFRDIARDAETLGGIVTFDKMADIFNMNLEEAVLPVPLLVTLPDRA